MLSITIRDIPPETLATLREQALDERRSINAELLNVLEQAAAERRRKLAFLSNAGQRREQARHHAAKVGDAGLTIDLIDEIIDGASHEGSGL